MDFVSIYALFGYDMNHSIDFGNLSTRCIHTAYRISASLASQTSSGSRAQTI